MASLSGQYIDARGAEIRSVRLKATADPQDWFAETNNRNNSTWDPARPARRVGRSELTINMSPGQDLT